MSISSPPRLELGDLGTNFSCIYYSSVKAGNMGSYLPFIRMPIPLSKKVYFMSSIHPVYPFGLNDQIAGVGNMTRQNLIDFNYSIG